MSTKPIAEMSYDEIRAIRTRDYSCLGSFLGLAELVKEDCIPLFLLRERMVELLDEYRGFKREHGVDVADSNGSERCNNEKGNDS